MRRAARNTPNPFREGFDARWSGKLRAQCPYPVATSRDAAEWLAGWDHADEVRRKRFKELQTKWDRIERVETP